MWSLVDFIQKINFAIVFINYKCIAMYATDMFMRYKCICLVIVT